MRLYPDLVDEPLAVLATELRMEPLELAAAIVEIANENMASAIKMVSIERGLDPRRFTLLAFGGAGPLHAAAIARSMGIPQVVVPPYPGVFSALGILLADIRVDKVWTQAFRSTDVDAELVASQFERITQRAVAELRREGFAGEPEIRRAITMRYLGQNYEHEVEIAPGVIDTAALEAAFRGFDHLHEERYGYLIEGEVIELVSFKVTAIGAAHRLDVRSTGATKSREPLRREVFFRGEGFVDVDVLRRAALAPDETITGPAVIEEEASTTLLAPGMSCRATAEGPLLISTEGAG
jgi:N-methylhydantoinase A